MYLLYVDSTVVASIETLAREESRALLIVLLVVIAVAGYALYLRLRGVMRKSAAIPSYKQMTGAEMAMKMLHAHGLYNVQITRARGHLANHFNPETLTINLSDAVYYGRTIEAMVIACHESGHAVQYVTGYNSLRLRSHLVAVVNFSSRVAPWLILLGLLFWSIMGNVVLCRLGVLFVVFSTIFAIATLPIENNASARAMEWLESREMLVGKDLESARLSLRWVARTCLVTALGAIATLINYAVGLLRRK